MRFLHDAWWRLATSPSQSFTENFIRGILRVAAWLYGCAMRVRNAAYDRGWLRQDRLPCPVISVGNLSVGGTGKTTCVEYLATKLTQLEMRVGVLSRGYGGRMRECRLVSQNGQLLVDGRPVSASDGLPDEPQLLAMRLPEVPVLVGARRERTGQTALSQFQTNVLLLDDGFQYRRLRRDCEIVLISARMPLAGWPLLPRGPMREPLESLRRADVILVTKADQSLERLAALQERLKSFNPEAVLATAIHEPEVLRDWATGERLAKDHLAGSRVSLVSSIGDPEGFEETVRSLDAAVASHAAFPDHYQYSAPEWERILRDAAASGATALVTTEKDAVRLQPFRQAPRSRLPVFVLSVRMRLLSGEEQLNDRLVRVCAR